MSKYSVLASLRSSSIFVLRIHAFVRRHLRHQPIAVARNALQRDAQHLVHLAVRLGGLEETNAVIVGVAHQLRELVLSQFALHSPAHGSGAEREPRHFDVGFSERHPIGRCPRAPLSRQDFRCPPARRGESGLQKITSGVVMNHSFLQCADRITN